MAVGNSVPFMGYDSCITVAKQLTTTTFVTGTAFLEFNSESMKREIEEVKLPSIRNSRSFIRRIQTNEVISGSIDYDLNPASDAGMWIIRQGMGGTSAVSVLSAAVSFQHTWYPGNMENTGSSAGSSPIRAVSISVRKGNTNTWDYNFCRVNSFTIKGEIGNPIAVTADIIGQSATAVSTIGTTAPTFTAINPLMFHNVVITTGISIGAASTEEFFTGFEFTVNNNIDTDQRSLGSKAVTQLPPVMRDVSLKLSSRFDTLTSYNRFIQATATAIKIVITSDTKITGSDTHYYIFEIDIPKAYYSGHVPEVGGSGVLAYEVNTAIVQDASSTVDCRILVKNGTANYD